MYKLIAVDLDGTLLNSQKEISPENLQALQEAMEKQIKVVVCSGRIFAGARFFARQLGTPDPVIACNGAIIRDMATDEVLRADGLSLENCRQAIELCHEEGIYYHVYIGDTMYAEKLEFSARFYWEKNQKLPEKDRVDIRIAEDMNRVLKEVEVLPSKIVSISRDPEHLQRVRTRMEQIQGMDVVSSFHDNFEVVNHGVSKGVALEFLCRRLGIKPEEVAAIGDNENDISMLRFAGLGIAMGNAEEMARQAACRVTLKNDEHGVAQAVRRYILSA